MLSCYCMIRKRTAKETIDNLFKRIEKPRSLNNSNLENSNSSKNTIWNKTK